MNKYIKKPEGPKRVSAASAFLFTLILVHFYILHIFWGHPIDTPLTSLRLIVSLAVARTKGSSDGSWCKWRETRWRRVEANDRRLRCWTWQLTSVPSTGLWTAARSTEASMSRVDGAVTLALMRGVWPFLLSCGRRAEYYAYSVLPTPVGASVNKTFPAVPGANHSVNTTPVSSWLSSLACPPWMFVAKSFVVVLFFSFLLQVPSVWPYLPVWSMAVVCVLLISLPTPTMSVGVGRIFESVCLSVCLSAV